MADFKPSEQISGVIQQQPRAKKQQFWNIPHMNDYFLKKKLQQFISGHVTRIFGIQVKRLVAVLQIKSRTKHF